jgi:D-alanine-D-alanine ligase
MGSSFGYFVDDRENKRILDEAFRLLMPKGTLLLDLPDRSYVLERLQPFSCHKATDDIYVTRIRELGEDIIYSRETVQSKEKGCIRDQTYCIRLYSEMSIASLLKASGFSSIAFQRDFISRKGKGDYGGMTNRMVVQARK